jgi:hypothetical protein
MKNDFYLFFSIIYFYFISSQILWDFNKVVINRIGLKKLMREKLRNVNYINRVWWCYNYNMGHCKNLLSLNN